MGFVKITCLDDLQLNSMNMKKCIFSLLTLFLFTAILSSCSESSDNNLEDDLTLVQLMEVKANTLTDAVVDISKSKGFEIITVEDGATVKNGEGGDNKFEMSIKLDDINGIYDYTKGMTGEQSTLKYAYKRYFNKVDDSDNFVLRLPKEKAMRPWKLYEDEETEYVNDFVITTTEYNYSYSGGLSFDYTLNSEIEVEEEEVGELYVDWTLAGEIPLDYESKFTFADGYSVGVEFMIGEAISYEFNLKKDDDILFQEEVEFSASEESEEGELEYSVTIGNIKIVLSSESETYMVYRDNELQEGATIEIVKHKNNGEGVAFCRKGRDIKITFADGDSIELSEFITDDTLELMDKIFSSMYDMKFVKHIVDKIAQEVYFTNIESGSV